MAYGHRLLRWLGDSGHGGKVPGSWHSQAAKPALGKCWQPAEQPCYKLIPILHKLLYGRASPAPRILRVPSRRRPRVWLFHESEAPQDSSACQAMSDLEEVSLRRARQRTRQLKVDRSLLGGKGRRKEGPGGMGHSQGCLAQALIQGAKHDCCPQSNACKSLLPPNPACSSYL